MLVSSFSVVNKVIYRLAIYRDITATTLTFSHQLNRDADVALKYTAGYELT